MHRQELWWAPEPSAGQQLTAEGVLDEQLVASRISKCGGAAPSVTTAFPETVVSCSLCHLRAPRDVQRTEKSLAMLGGSGQECHSGA